MAFITAETRSDLIALSVGMLKQAPSNALLEELIALSVDGGTLADAADHIAKTAAFKAEYPSFQTAAQYAAEIFDNITTGGTVTAEIRTAVIDLATGYLTSGAYSKAGLALAIVDFLSQPAALLNSDFADIAQSVQNRSAAAEYFVVTKELGGSTDAELAAAVASVTSDAATLTAANAAADTTAAAVAVVPGQTFTLTTGLDTGASFTGGAGNDTFSAIESVTSPVSDSLTAGDSLAGGAGTDTLVVAVSGNVATTAGVATTGIEAASVYNNNAAQTYTLDATLMSGLTDVYVNGGTSATIVNAVGSLPNLHLTSTSQDATVTATAAATAGDASAVTIASNASALTSSATATYNGVETINLAVAGATGTGGLTNYRLNLVSDQLETIKVTGSANAYVAATFTGAAADSQTSTFDASAATGNVTVDFTRGASATSAVTMGAGNDHVDFLSTLSEKDVIVGGEGTDTLEIGGTNDYGLTAATQDNGSGISGFEVLRLKSAAVVDARILTNNDAITNVVFEAGGSYTDSAVTDVTNLSSGTVVLDLATDSAADAVNFTAAGTGAITSTLTALDMETINVTTGGLGDIGLTISGATADVTKVVAAGTQSLNLTVAGTSIATVDASGVTGLGESFTLSATASTADMTVTPSGVTPSDADTDTANTITTGAGDDTLTGTAYIDVLTGGAGADTITGGGGLDQLNGGAGNDSITGGADNDAISDGAGDDVVSAGDGIDTITLGAGSDNIDGGAGNDVITAGSNLSSGDTIDGGTGTDALTATLSGAGIAPTISGTESISIGFGASTYIDMANVTNVSSLVIDADTSGAAAQVKNLVSGATVTVTDERSLAGAGNITSLTVDTADAATLGVKIAANANAATAAATSITGITVTDAASVAISNVGGGVDNVLDHQITGNLALDDTDTTSLSLTSSAYGSLDFVANDVTGTSELKTFTVSAAAYGDITLDTIIDAEELQTISMTASGESSDVNIGAIGGTTASTALSSISLTATAGGEIDTGAISGSNANMGSITISADGANSDVTPGGAITTGNGAITTVTLSATNRGNVDMTSGDLTVGSGLISNFSASAGSRGTLDLAGFASSSTSTQTAGAYALSTSDRGSMTLGDLSLLTDGALTSLTVTVGEDSTMSFGTGNIESAGTITTLSVSTAADAITSGALALGDAAAAITSATVSLDADATNDGDIDITGAVATAVTFTLGGTADIQLNGTTAGDITVGYDGNADAITTTLTSITTLTVNASANSGGASEVNLALAAKANYSGTSGVDLVYGAAGADTITGGAGADTISGGAGNDGIDGGSDADVLSGGAGSDTLTGGTGADVFAYTSQGAFTITETTAGALGIAEVQSMVISGSFVAGEIISVGDGTNTITYTVLAGDSITDIAAGVTAAITAGTYLYDASASGGTITLTETAVIGDADLAMQTASVTTQILKETDASVSVSGSTVSGQDIITDFASVDSIALPATATAASTATAVAGASGTAGTTATTNVEVSAGGKVTFAAADDTLAERVVAIAADDTDLADGEVAFFEHGGNTYVYIADDTDVATTDALIQLTGVTGYTTASISSGVLTFA